MVEQLVPIREVHARCSAVDRAIDLTQELWRLVLERDQAGKDPWLTAARASGVPELREFVAGIERDRAAVEAALRQEVTNDQPKGHITKRKLLKRTASGRASLTLLRPRLLRTGRFGSSACTANLAWCRRPNSKPAITRLGAIQFF